MKLVLIVAIILSIMILPAFVPDARGRPRTTVRTRCAWQPKPTAEFGTRAVVALGDGGPWAVPTLTTGPAGWQFPGTPAPAGPGEANGPPPARDYPDP